MRREACERVIGHQGVGDDIGFRRPAGAAGEAAIGEHEHPVALRAVQPHALGAMNQGARIAVQIEQRGFAAVGCRIPGDETLAVGCGQLHFRDAL